jgi:T3SS (YopN, CesT) and YbjN peptide-binding chaperone 1
MTHPDAARSFLLGEVEALEPFDFVAASPAGNPLHVVEVTRREDGGLEVRVPGRPRIVPELTVPVRSGLRDRGFASTDPADPTQAWVRDASDAGAAVELVRKLLSEVFGEKPDVALDIAHGSHRAEHEARQKLAALRERVEKVVSDLLGSRPEQDEDGDYVLPVKDVHVVVAPRVMPGGRVIVRIFAITNVGVTVAPELGLFLARLNFGLMFGRFALDAEHRAIWFDETLLVHEFSEEELRFAIDVVASTADQWDDRLKQMFGGATYQEVLTGRSGHAAPPTKPGDGGYI